MMKDDLHETKRDLHRDGRPLAVCINDCQIDCGQSKSELKRLCFQLNCAFAEMRWGTCEDYRCTELSAAGGSSSAIVSITA